jgi:hypothetical protein
MDLKHSAPQVKRSLSEALLQRSAPLFPHPGHPGPAMRASAVFDPKFADLKPPAFDQYFTATVTKRILGSIAGNISGVYIS